MFLLFGVLSLTACKPSQLELPSVSSSTISGRFVELNSLSLASSMKTPTASGVSTLSCSSPTAQLYRVNTEGVRVEPAISTSILTADGSYSFEVRSNGISVKGQSVTDSFVVVISGCSSGVYLRPITGTKDQDVSMGSTVISYLLNTNLKDTFAEKIKSHPSAIDSLIQSLSASNTLADAYSTLTSNATVQSQFTQAFGSAPTVLNQAAPEILSLEAPSTASENSPVTLSVTSSHWSSSYLPVYLWKLDGNPLSQSRSFTYTPTSNSQGTHTLQLTMGENNGSGQIDTTKPTKVIERTLVISNNSPAISPTFVVSSPSSVGSVPINTRQISIDINTGTLRSHCDSFSSLALTENSSSTPPSSAFTISCLQANLQTENFTLTSSGDGVKTLRLWARDADGNISVTPSLVSVALDTTTPATSITSTPPSLSSSSTQNFTFVADDNGGSIDHFECRLNANNWTNCSSPKTYSSLAQGTHTFYVKAIDTAGNESPIVSQTWTLDLTPPTLTISGSPNAVTQQASSQFTFSASDSGGGIVAGFQCQVDSGAWSSCSSPFIQVLSAGSHNFSVKAVDSAGNASAPLTYSWNIDLSAPTVTISSHPISLTNSTSATFTFSGTDTGGGTVDSYQCSLDNGGYSQCVSPKTYSGLSSGAHSFRVKAIDTANNIGTPTTISWTIDTSTPLAAILTQPTNLTNNTSATFTFSANPPPGGSITGYECQIGSSGWSSCSSPKNYLSLTQGAQTFQVRSIDNNNNRSAPSSASWTIDLTSPTLTLSTQPSSITNSSTALFSFSASDSSGIESYSCRRNSGAWTTCSSPLTYNSLTAGVHTVEIKALDLAGNESATSSVTWTVDTSAPTVTFSSQPSSITNSTSATFNFTGNDTGGGSIASFRCSLDGSTASVCTSPLIASGLAAGTHSFSIYSLDTAGNSSSTNTVSWTIDTTAPTVNVTTSPSSVTNSTTASFTFTANDTGGGSIAGFQCSWDGATATACSSPASVSSLSAGNHSFTVIALDSAGNSSSAYTTNWSIDLTAPTLTITTPATNGVILPAASLNNYLVSGSCSENSRTVNLTGSISTTATCSASTWSKSLDLSSVPDGVLNLIASQTDEAGNTGSSASRTFIKDTLAPVITVTTPSTTRGNGSYGSFTWSMTESSIAASTSFTLEIFDGSTWNSLSTVPVTAGSYSNSSFNLSNFNVPNINTNSARLRATITDAAGNSTTSTTNAFSIDSLPPTLSSITLNSGASVALSPNLNVTIDASDAIAGVSAIRIADATGSNCQLSYSNSNWLSYSSGVGAQTYSYLTGFTNGNHQVCVWAKDAVGNISEITTNSQSGTTGIDTASIRLDQGNPPGFTSVNVTNGNSASANYGTTTFASGEAVSIQFTVTDDSALATQPVSIYVTTDNTNYTLIANSATVGTAGSNQTSWTKTYTGYTAPTASYFRIRLVATDANGNTSQILSTPLNTGKWTLYAGNSDTGVGSSALSARIKAKTIDVTKNSTAVTSRNVMFFSASDGLYYIDPTTGNYNSYVRCGSMVGIPGVINSSTRIPSCFSEVYADGTDLYLRNSNYIFHIDTVTNYIKVYAGGGTSVTTSDPSLLQIWQFGVFTMNPDTKDIYLTNVCDPTHFNLQTSTTGTYKIQKISQNTISKTATTVSDFAGNCVKGTPISGNAALNTPLENNFIFSAFGSLTYVPSINALYFAPYSQKLIKIINNTLYISTSLSTTSLRGGVYIPEQNKIFYSQPGSGVFSFTPNNNLAFNETITKYINDESMFTDSSCRNDGVSITNAGVYTGSLFKIGNNLGIVDNTTNTDLPARIRVADSSTETLQTLAGADRFVGGTGDKTLAKFAAIEDINYKISNSGNTPASLYIADSGASRIISSNPSQNSLQVFAGLGLNKGTATGVSFDTNTSLSILGVSTNLFSVGFNNYGNFIYVGQGLYSVDSSNTVQTYLSASASTSALTMPEGSTNGGSYRLLNESRDGVLSDHLGNIYFGGSNSTTNGGSGYNRIKVRLSTGEFFTVIGTNSNSVSPDCSTPGCATTQSIYVSSMGTSVLGVNRLAKIFDSRFNSGDGRLFFTEGQFIRFVSKPYDRLNSKLGTLATQAGTAINFGRTVGGFVFTYVDNTSEQIDRVYYLSNNQLYCYKVSSGSDSSCNNTSLGPSSSLTYLYDTLITMDPQGNIYVVNSSRNAIFKYSP